MVTVSESINQFLEITLIKLFKGIFGAIPEEFKTYFILGFAIIGILLYSIFIWKFYRLFAKRDIIELNLKQYNKLKFSFLRKLTAIGLFFLEFIIILPILVFFWFFIMAVILLFLAKDLAISDILLISASIVGAVRIAAYYNEDLSRELAKLFPFLILTIALLTPGFFNAESNLTKLASIGNILPHIFIYLIVIMIIEFILRILQIITPEKSNKMLKLD